MRCPVCGGWAKKVGEDRYGIIYRCSVCGYEWTDLRVSVKPVEVRRKPKPEVHLKKTAPSQYVFTFHELDIKPFLKIAMKHRYGLGGPSFKQYKDYTRVFFPTPKGEIISVGTLTHDKFITNDKILALELAKLLETAFEKEVPIEEEI